MKPFIIKKRSIHIMKVGKLFILVPCLLLSACNSSNSQSLSSQSGTSSSVVSTVASSTTSSVASSAVSSAASSAVVSSAVSSAVSSTVISSQTSPVSSAVSSSLPISSSSQGIIDVDNKETIIANLDKVSNFDLNYMTIMSAYSPKTQYRPAMSMTRTYDSNIRKLGENSAVRATSYTNNTYSVKDAAELSKMSEEAFLSFLLSMDSDEYDIVISDDKSEYSTIYKESGYYNYDLYDETNEQYYYVTTDEKGDVKDLHYYADSYISETDMLFSVFSTLSRKTVILGEHDAAKHQYSLTSDKFDEEISKELAQVMGELPVGFESIITTFADNELTKLELTYDKESLREMMRLSEGDTLGEQNGVYLTINSFKDVKIDDLPSQTPKCENHEIKPFIYDCNESGYRKRCDDCGLYLDERKPYDYDETYGVCKVSGHIRGCSDKYISEEDYLLKEFPDGGKYYLFGFRKTEDGRIFGVDIGHYEQPIDNTSDSGNQPHLMYYEYTLDNGLDAHYLPDFDILYTQEEGVPNSIGNNSCYTVSEVSYKVYKNIGGENLSFDSSSDDVKALINAATPYKSFNAYNVYTVHASTEQIVKIDSCISMEISTCSRCGNITQTTDIIEHNYTGIESLTYDQYAEALGDYSTNIDKDNAYYFSAKCDKCDKDLYFNYSNIHDGNLISHADDINHPLYAFLFDSANKKFYYNVTIPHITDEHDNCLICGANILDLGEYKAATKYADGYVIYKIVDNNYYNYSDQLIDFDHNIIYDEKNNQIGHFEYDNENNKVTFFSETYPSGVVFGGN